MGGTVVGRDAVLADAWSALQDRRTVLLAGPAGIGKTAVLRDLVARARADGYLVVGCAPTEVETALPLAAVADLLQPLYVHADVLPEPQRAAVDAALLLGSGGAPVDERALAAATRALLDEAAAHGPVILAVDDAPWLDPPSERALRFALRRLAGIGVLVGSRIRDDDPAPLGLDSAERLTRIALTPLGAGPLHHLIASRFGVSLSRPLLARVADESAGNPLLAIELARSVLRLPVPPAPGDDLPVAASMQDLVAATLAALPAPGRDAVRLAALLSTPHVADLVAAGADAAALDAAEEAGLVTVGPDDRIRFVHPVHASAVRAAMPGRARRRMHASLAAVVADPDERARHLARATTRPDAAASAEIAAAAARARARGAAEVAAGLYDRAAELTPATLGDAQHARCLEAVHCRFDSGDFGTAGAQADAIAAEAGGDVRAAALLLRAAIAWSADDVGRARSAAQDALATATPGTRLAGRIHARLAVFVHDPAVAAEHATAARALLADGADDPGPTHRDLLGQDDRATLASALMSLFYNEVLAGAPPRQDLLDEALSVEGDRPSWLAGTIPGIFWKGIDEHDRARQRFAWMYERAVALGDEPFQHELMIHLGETEIFAGRFDDARRWIGAASELGEQLGTELISENYLAGLLDTRVGNVAAAAARAETGLRLAAETDDAWRRRINLMLAGSAALAEERFSDAAAAYDELADAVDATGLVEPLGIRFEADWVEACVAIGDLDNAARALERLSARHERLPRPWTSLGLARSRVLIDAAGGRPVEAAVEALAAARDTVPADVVPLERARCLLVAGIAHRRARRKRPARETLETAAAEFAALGAGPLADRAVTELARIGGRPAAPLELTPTESRVARLAAAGRTNRAIADALFVSPKTVEANLARIYRKLGIATRAELGAVMSTRDA